MKQVILFITLVLSTYFIRAQVSSYTFTPLNGTYTQLTGGTNVNAIEDDDVYSAPINIGFNFVFNGTTYTQVVASSNGWLSFNTATASSGITNDLDNSSSTIRPLVAPLWDDLDGFDGPGQASYTVSGVAPNRIFTFEWRDWEWDFGADVPVISFQVKLYETTNVIDFVYRSEGGSVVSADASIGIAGQTIGTGNFLSLNNTSASPTASSTVETNTLSSKPATGQVYRFSPPVPPPACTGTPNGGVAVTNSSYVCSGAAFRLSVTGATTGVTGLTYQWQSSPDAVAWTNISGATNSTYTTSITTNTYYRRGTICTGNTGYSSYVLVSIFAPVVSPANYTICLNSSQNITATLPNKPVLFSEDFEGTLQMTVVNGTPHYPGTEWILRTSPHTYTGTVTTTFSSPNADKFMLANSDDGPVPENTNTKLESPAINTTGYSALNLNFNHYYNYYTGDVGTVEVSTNGGGAWTVIATYNTDIGTSTSFVPESLNLNAYVGFADVRFRFNYLATWDWYWAVDDIVLSGTQSPTQYSWIATPALNAGLPAPAGTPNTANSNITVTPTSTGIFTYTVNANTGCAQTNSVVLNVVAGVGGLVSTNVCKTQSVTTGHNYFFENASCKLMADVLPSGASPVNGNVNTCVTFDATVQFFNAEPYVQRHFDIEPAVNAATSTATVTLYFTDAEFVNFNANNASWPDLPTVAGGGNADPNRNNLRVTQYHGTPTTSPSQPGMYTGNSGSGVLLTPTSVFYNATLNHWEVTVTVNGFSGFYVHTNLFWPLPIVFNYLNGVRQGINHLLNWKVTCTGSPTATLILERSGDNRIFTAINNITATALRCADPFSYTDANPLLGLNYYRVKFIDAYGKVSYGNTIALLNAVKGFEVLNVAPNPVTSNGAFKLNVSAAKAEVLGVVITDMQGRVVERKQINVIGGYNSIAMDISKLASGTYNLQVTSTVNDKSKVLRVIKQ